MPTKSPLRVLLAASEAVPFCKTGGLADVAGSLGVYLPPHVEELTLFLPCYKAIKDQKSLKLSSVPKDFLIPLAGRVERVRLLWSDLAGAGRRQSRGYLVDHPSFNREGLYGTGGQDHPDNAQRFILFARSVLEGAKFVGFRPDIIHCHDWQTGLIPAYLKTVYHLDAFFRRTASVFTIHNIAYQGNFPPAAMEDAGLPVEEFRMEKLEFFGQLSFLKAGLVYSDIISTVSPNYAQEIQTGPDKGRGFEGLLRCRQHDLVGIINGIDTKLWDPGQDPHLACNYNHGRSPAKYAKAKAQCKLRLQKTLGLTESAGTPMFGMVSRMDYQKGIDLVTEALAELLPGENLQAVLLGVGDLRYQAQLNELSKKFPGQFRAIFEFNDPLAHQIYAASDCFLMPSRFEPCGLGQMIAMRYGSLPLVAKTGGLADTVTEEKGFMLSEFSTAGLAKTMTHALRLYQDHAAWNRLVKNAIDTDFSWENSIGKYLEMYQTAASRKAAEK